MFRGFAKNPGMLKSQLCPVWVAERFPELLMVANEQGDIFLGKGLLSASCWDIGSSQRGYHVGKRQSPGMGKLGKFKTFVQGASGRTC